MVRGSTLRSLLLLGLCNIAAGDPDNQPKADALSTAAGTWWLGHLLVDPTRRSLGYGLELTRALTRRALDWRLPLKVIVARGPLC